MAQLPAGSPDNILVTFKSLAILIGILFPFQNRNQLNVTVGGLEGSSPVTCSRQVVIVPDKAITDAATVSLNFGFFLVFDTISGLILRAGVFRCNFLTRWSGWRKEYERIEISG